MVDGGKNKEPPPSKHSKYSFTLTYNGRFCAEYLNLHVGLGRVCTQCAAGRGGGGRWSGGGVLYQAGRDVTASSHFPSPPAASEKAEGGWGEKNEFTRWSLHLLSYTCER